MTHVLSYVNVIEMTDKSNYVNMHPDVYRDKPKH